MTEAAFQDAPPQSDEITPYDEQHLVTYLRLLDAEENGADWREVVAIVLGFNPSGDAERAKRVHTAHLERARWMTTHGYRHLLDEKRKQQPVS
jgi:hypothetical protein